MRRFVLLLIVAAGAVALAGSSVTHADTGDFYAASLSAGSYPAGSTATFTITNSPASTNPLGSATIAITGFTPTTVSATGPSGKTWTAAVNAGVIELKAATNTTTDTLAPGESVTVTSDIPTTPGSYSTTTAAYNSNDLTAPTDANSGSDPTLTVTPGPVDHFVWTSQPSSPQKAGGSFPAAVTAYDAFGNVKTDYDWSSQAQFSGLSGAPNGTPANPVYAADTTTNPGVATGFTDFKTEPGPLPGGGTAITVKDSVHTSIQATSDRFVVDPAALGSFAWTLPAMPPNPKAGTPFNASATAKDLYGNVKTDYGGNATFSGLHNSPSGCDATGHTPPAGTNPCLPVYPSSWLNGVSSGSFTDSTLR